MSVIGTTMSKGMRHSEDKFYTKTHVVEQLLESFEKITSLSSYDLIIEPSAGSGAFSHKLQNIHTNVKAYDISPESADIIQANWLELDKSIFNNTGRILVIGNPPFGVKGKIASQFIHESSFADTIAFILPKGFKKESVQNRMPLDFHLIYEEDIDASSFTVEDEDYSVPCVFQIWVKKEEQRKIQKRKYTSEYYDFVSSDSADLTIRRIGGNAGQARATTIGSIHSNFFIKNNTLFSNDEFIDIVNTLQYESVEDTTGPKCLPKWELIAILDKKLSERIFDSQS